MVPDTVKGTNTYQAMAKKGFLTKATYSNWLWMTGILVVSASILLTYAFFPDAASARMDNTVFEHFPGFDFVSGWIYGYLDSLWLRYLIAFFSIIGGAVLVQFLSSDNRLVRVRSFFPFFLYCLITAAFFPHVSPLRTYVAALFLLAACLRVFSVVERQDISRALFDASLFLGMASLTLNRLTWLLPFFWVAAAQQQPLTVKNLLASLIGFGTIYWMIAGVSVLLWDFRYLQHWADNVWAFDWMQWHTVTPLAATLLVFLTLVLIVAFSSFMQQRNQDKLRTRNQLYGVMILWIGAATLWLTAFTSNTAFLLLTLMPAVIFWAHFFSLKDNRFSRLLFLLLLLLCGFVSLFYTPF